MRDDTKNMLADIAIAFLVVLAFTLALVFGMSCAAVQRQSEKHPDAKKAIAQFVVCMLEPAPVLLTSGADATESKRLLFSRFAYCLGQVLDGTSTVTTTSVEVN